MISKNILNAFTLWLLTCMCTGLVNGQTSSYNGNANNIQGTDNTGFGCGALINITNAANGSYNVAFGIGSGLDCTSGSYNTAVGAGSLEYNATGNNNTGLGGSTLLGVGYSFSNNTAIGGNVLAYTTVSDNTGAGYLALQENTSGTLNSALGSSSLTNNTTGSNNVGLGFSTLQANVGGGSNTAAGSGAMYYNGSADGAGSENSAFGYQAMYWGGNTTSSASYSLAFGSLAAYGGKSGGSNDVAVGYTSSYNSTGTYNTALGNASLHGNTTGGYNTALGMQALYTCTEGSLNVAAGYQSLYTLNNTTGGMYYNTAVGASSLYSATGSQSQNSALGANALKAMASGYGNTGLGYQVLLNESAGLYNTAMGSNAASGVLAGTNGSNGNTALGYGTATNQTSYSFCLFLGSGADAAAGNYVLSGAIGYNTTVDASQKIRFGNNSVSVIDGHVAWTTPSDGRFKTNIKEEVPGLEFISKLRPVAYNFDTKKFDAFLMKNMPEKVRDERMANTDYSASTNVRQSGFIAQEVQQAMEATNYDFNGLHKPVDDNDNYSVAYDVFVVPLVKGMQQNEATIENADKSVTAFTNKIQALSAQVQDLKESVNNGNEVSDINGVVKSGNTPFLFNAVPNPTSESSVISYYIPVSATSARIELRDMEGRQVESIPVAALGYGSYTLTTKGLSSGVYLYSLVVDNQVTGTKKLSVTLK